MSEKKTMVRIVDNSVPRKTPEDKEYLICFVGTDSDNTWWEIIKGRSEVYDTIKTVADYIDLEESFVLVESCTLLQRKSVYSFMKYAKQFYQEDSFDIDEHISASNTETDDSIPVNEINALIDIPSSERLSGADILAPNYE
jgi:hypothetical protein